MLVLKKKWASRKFNKNEIGHYPNQRMQYKILPQAIHGIPRLDGKLRFFRIEVKNPYCIYFRHTFHFGLYRHNCCAYVCILKTFQLTILEAISVTLDLHQGPHFFPLSDSHLWDRPPPLGHDHILQTFGVSKLNHAHLPVYPRPELLSWPSPKRVYVKILLFEMTIIIPNHPKLICCLGACKN